MQKLVVFDGKVTSRTIEGDYVIGISSKKEADDRVIQIASSGTVGIRKNRMMQDLAASVHKIAVELADESEGTKMELLTQFMSHLLLEAELYDEEEA